MVHTALNRRKLTTGGFVSCASGLSVRETPRAHFKLSSRTQKFPNSSNPDSVNSSGKRCTYEISDDLVATRRQTQSSTLRLSPKNLDRSASRASFGNAPLTSLQDLCPQPEAPQISQGPSLISSTVHPLRSTHPLSQEMLTAHETHLLSNGFFEEWKSNSSSSTLSEPECLAPDQLKRQHIPAQIRKTTLTNLRLDNDHNAHSRPAEIERPESQRQIRQVQLPQLIVTGASDVQTLLSTQRPATFAQSEFERQLKPFHLTSNLLLIRCPGAADRSLAQAENERAQSRNESTSKLFCPLIRFLHPYVLFQIH